MLAIKRKDVLIAIGLGVFVSSLLAIFRCPISAPSLWHPLSEALGLIPPDDPMPGLWRMIVAGLAGWVGTGSIDAALMWCGHLAIGTCTVCIYLIFGNVIMPLEQLALRRRVNWSRHVLYILAGIGTLLVAFSEPVWRMGQTFLPETLELLITLPAVLLFVMFLRTGRLLLVGLAVALCGVLAGESVAGVLLGLAVLVATYFSAFLTCGTQFTFANLVALPFLEDNSVYHQKCRQRGGADQEDRDMLAFGSADLLRTWANAKPERLSSMATQIGLELWKRQGRTMPTCAGLLARTAGLDAQAVSNGCARAWALADRILALRKDNPDLDGNADRLLADLFLHIQWRVAWFCHRRSEQADRADDLALSEKEEKLGTALDEANPALSRMRQKASGLTVWQTGRLMPREGLRIGLERLDFLMARQYAQKVLQTDPDYTPANFAMGMSYLKEEQYNKAASYLRRCVEKSPNDVSAWNNLAVVYQRQGALDEALAAAERALEAAKSLKTPQVRERALKDVGRTHRFILGLMQNREKR